MDDLSQEVENLKEVAGAYKKVQQLTDTYALIITQFETATGALEKAHERQKDLEDKINNSLAEIEHSNQSSKLELLKLTEAKADQIRKENKEFYKELESTIRIKLSENKSEIKELIERERQQTRQIFGLEFAKNSRELKTAIETAAAVQTEVLTASQQRIKMIVWIIGGLNCLLLLALLYKVWLT
ncbi:hypothetical protein [Chitinophaga sp.]|uniref:hypothetical protein n=1 Tax=Chitinophaga sp. TaxID=1869181 RepID=UPI002F9545B6